MLKTGWRIAPDEEEQQLAVLPQLAEVEAGPAARRPDSDMKQPRTRRRGCHLRFQAQGFSRKRRHQAKP